MDSTTAKKDFTFIDLFAGIGGIRIGFESNGGECVFSSDWDEDAQKTYHANFGEKPHGDITKVDINSIPNFNILLAGFPCQPFSIAGYRKGFNDSGRGDLFFKILEVLELKNPNAFLLENVKNLVSHDKGETIKFIKEELEKLGYFVDYKVLNTCDYGNIPQNRERVYIVGFKNKESFKNFEFPQKQPLTVELKNILEKKVSDKYYYTSKSLIYDKLKNDVNNSNTVYQWRRVYVRENKNNLCPTLTANMGMGGHNVPIIKDSVGIRKLTPKECSRLQGFPDSFILPIMADSRLYKQFGNSVSVPVLKKIAEQIKKVLIIN